MMVTDGGLPSRKSKVANTHQNFALVGYIGYNLQLLEEIIHCFQDQAVRSGISTTRGLALEKTELAPGHSMRPFRLNRLAMTNGKAVIIIQAAMEGLMAAWPCLNHCFI